MEKGTKMNANEIAQEFEDYLKEIEELPWGNHQILCDQAATMLRQQQAEIENLKRINRQEHIVAENALKEIEALKAKTLTDEEIEELWYDPRFIGDPVAFGKAVLRATQNITLQTDEEICKKCDALTERAILRKAQEK